MSIDAIGTAPATSQTQARAQHRARRQREHPPAARRRDPAARHPADADRAVSVRDVLAAVEVRRVRRLRNVDVVADHRDLARADAVGRDPGVHDPRVLPHPHPGPRRLRDRQARRSASASASACRSISRPRRSGAAARCSTSSALQPRDIEWFMERVAGEEPRRLDRASRRRPASPSTRSAESTNIGEMLVRGELDATLLYLVNRNLVDRSRLDLTNDPRVPLSVPRPRRGGPALLRQDRHLSDQPHRGGAALAAREPSVDRAQPLQRVRRGPRRGGPPRQHDAEGLSRARPARRRGARAR